MVAAQKVADSFVVGVGRVNPLQYRAISLQQPFCGHCRNETQNTIDVVSICVTDKASFTHEPPIELSAGECLQNSYHRDRDRTLLNEGDLPVEDVFRVAVETHDERGHPLNG